MAASIIIIWVALGSVSAVLALTGTQSAGCTICGCVSAITAAAIPLPARYQLAAFIVVSAMSYSVYLLRKRFTKN